MKDMKNDTKTTDHNTKKLIRDTLLALGIAPHVKGFAHLEDVFKILLSNKEHLYAIHKEVYFQVAKLHNTTPNRVERCIRHAKEDAEWGTPLWNELFQYVGPDQRNTNAYFFARVLMYLEETLAGRDDGGERVAGE